MVCFNHSIGTTGYIATTITIFTIVTTFTYVMYVTTVVHCHYCHYYYCEVLSATFHKILEQTNQPIEELEDF